MKQGITLQPVHAETATPLISIRPKAPFQWPPSRNPSYLSYPPTPPVRPARSELPDAVKTPVHEYLVVPNVTGAKKIKERKASRGNYIPQRPVQPNANSVVNPGTRLATDNFTATGTVRKRTPFLTTIGLLRIERKDPQQSALRKAHPLPPCNSYHLTLICFFSLSFIVTCTARFIMLIAFRRLFINSSLLTGILFTETLSIHWSMKCHMDYSNKRFLLCSPISLFITVLWQQLIAWGRLFEIPVTKFILSL